MDVASGEHSALVAIRILRVARGRCGQLHRKGRAKSFAPAFRSHNSAMQFHKMTHDGEAETETTTGVLGVIYTALPETIKHVRQKIRLDSLATIGDHHLDIGIHLFHANIDV